MIGQTWQLLRVWPCTLPRCIRTSFDGHTCIRIRLFCLEEQTNLCVPTLRLHQNMRLLRQGDHATPIDAHRAQFLADGMASALRTTSQAIQPFDHEGNCGCVETA